MVIFITASCHKSKNTPQSKIIYIIDSIHYKFNNPTGKKYAYVISYNANGTLNTIQSTTADLLGNFESTIFDYFPGIVVKKESTAGLPPFMTVDTFYLNLVGDIYKISDGTSSYTFTFQYSGNEIVNSAYKSGYTNIWSNGNNLKMFGPSGNSDTITNTFYSNIPYAPGDYIYIKELLQWGKPLTHNKNLIASSIYSGNNTITDNYTYVFDSKNRVISCILTESSGDYYERIQVQYDN